MDPPDAFIVLPQLGEQDRIPEVRIGIVALEVQRLLQLALGRRPIPVEQKVDDSKPGVRL